MIRLVITRALVAIAVAGLAGCAVQTATSEEVGVSVNAQTSEHQPSLQVTASPCINTPQPWNGVPCPVTAGPANTNNNVNNGNGNATPGNGGQGAPSPAAH